MDWFKKHVDTVIVLGGILGAICWMNGKFNSFEQDVNNRFNGICKNINEIEKNVTIIKTVLMVKDIYPKELAKHHGDEK